MSKPRGFSDPNPMTIQPEGYISFTSTLPTDLGKKVPVAEPFPSIAAPDLLGLDVSHAGWIRKEGFAVKSWKSRYMVLYHGCVYYFKGTDSTTARGKFSLNDYKCETAPEREHTDRYPFVFKVVPEIETDRTYYFSSPSKAEMEAWIKKINVEVKLYCTSPSETYDYVENAEINCVPKFPTIPRQAPSIPARKLSSYSVEETLFQMRLTGSPTVDLSLPSGRAFPKNPPRSDRPVAKIPPVCSDSDSDDDSSDQPLYIHVIADDEDMSCPEETHQNPQQSRRGKPPVLPPKAPKGIPTAGKGVKMNQQIPEVFDYLPNGCFQPDLHKNQAKVFLELHLRVGSYIVHASESSDTKLGLSVWGDEGKIKRYLIFKRNGMFTLDPNADHVESFSDLTNLIQYYYSNPLPKGILLLTAPFSL